MPITHKIAAARRRECRCSPARNCRLRRQGEPVFTGGDAVLTARGKIAAERRRGMPVFTGGNKRGQDTKYGFLSPLDSPYLPLR